MILVSYLLLVVVPTAATALLNIWPSPLEITTGNVTTSIGGHVGSVFFTMEGDSKLLSQAFDRYATLTFPHVSHSGSSGILSLKVVVEDLDESHPQLGVDESYKLDVSTSGATLTSKTVWGALRGLETFSQIVSFNFEEETYEIPSTPILINDAPRFPHRGLVRIISELKRALTFYLLTHPLTHFYNNMYR